MGALEVLDANVDFDDRMRLAIVVIADELPTQAMSMPIGSVTRVAQLRTAPILVIVPAKSVEEGSGENGVAVPERSRLGIEEVNGGGLIKEKGITVGVEDMVEDGVVVTNERQ